MKTLQIDRVLRRLVLQEPTSYPTGCWDWPGATNKDGYGIIEVGSANPRVHRLVYEHFVGPIPSGFLLRQDCGNRRCANFEHQEMLSRKEHARRFPPPNPGSMTHCKRGHPLFGDNLRVLKGGERVCLACERLRHEMWLAANPGKYREYRRRHYLKKTGRTEEDVARDAAERVQQPRYRPPLDQSARNVAAKRLKRGRVLICEACGFEPCASIASAVVHAHHVTRVADGGGHEDENLLLLCANCHAAEHALLRLTKGHYGRLSKEEVLAALRDPQGYLEMAEWLDDGEVG